MKNICVLGSGAWGTAISCVLAENGHNVKIFGVNEKEIADINDNRTNSRFFDFDLKLPENVVATLDFDFAAKNAEVIVIAVPSYAIEDTVKKTLPYLGDDTLVVNLAKGFDEATKKTVGDWIRSMLPLKNRGNTVSLLGPTFALEVAEKQFTTITAASHSKSACKRVQNIFSTPYFRVYTNNDPIGAEYCSALKNVIAIACGVADGLGCKVNTRAALITRGLAEITHFVKRLGGRESTCYGLTGVGDLTLTCSSKTSRNYTAGYEIGKTSFAEFNASNDKTVEGLFACIIAYELAEEFGIAAPIVRFVYSVTHDGKDVKTEFDNLKLLIIGEE